MKPLFHLSITECREGAVDNYRVLATVMESGEVLKGLTASDKEFVGAVEFLNAYGLEERLRKESVSRGKKV